MVTTSSRASHANAHHRRDGLARILVATDFSRSARCALERALLLPLAGGATIDLVHVRDGNSADDEQAPLALEHLAQEIALRGAPRGLRVAHRCVAGSVGQAIAHEAALRAAELVIVGKPAARRGWDLARRRPVARAVRQAHVPVLVVLREPTASYRRPLVALALDETDDRALDTCVHVVGPTVLDISVVHGVHVPFVGLASSAGATSAYHRSFQEDAEAELERRLGRRAPDNVRWHRVLGRGEREGMILDAVLTTACDLVVVGMHDRGGLQALRRTVAESLIEASTCDVLIACPERVGQEP